MKVAKDTTHVLAELSENRLLDLERALIRIPSSTFKEQAIADFLANYMSDIGLDVEMMDVPHPDDDNIVSRQPIGVLRGNGSGTSLMLNGHMDPGIEMSGWSVDPYGAKFEDGWIWGMGAHDDKGGIAAMVTAVDAIIRSGTSLKGDVVVCPVVAHKHGGAGTRALLRSGIAADCCINMEHSNNTIANVCVGIAIAQIKATAPDLFFRFNAEARAAYINPVEQQMAVIGRLGPSLDAIDPGGWLTFTPHPDLPDFPKHLIDIIHKEHYFHKDFTGLSTRTCEMELQIRTVPGQTADSIRDDLQRLLDAICAEKPACNFTLSLPAPGSEETWLQAPMEVGRDHPLVTNLADGYRVACDAEPMIGGNGRIGNVGDGNILAAAGIPSVQFGAGDIRIYREWPSPDERVTLRDLVVASRSVAHAVCGICG